MSPVAGGPIRSAEVVLPCAELDPTLAFFTERLGFRVDAIFPADDPSIAVVSGHGLRVRLQRGTDASPGVLRLTCADPAALGGAGAAVLTAPNGTRIELVGADPPLVVPPLRPSMVVTRSGAPDAWRPGRAGMQYRDLLPDRQGGRFVASHIRIADGGPVPDYVHFHRVRVQVIYCVAGWVRVVYEDQGAPFLLEPGDCVLQPPRIRHRVLEASAGLEVIEIASPAEHETFADHDVDLPTKARQRSYDGQTFVRHRAASATWRPWRVDGFEHRDTGIADATGGLASVRVVRARGPAPAAPRAGAHHAELRFMFALRGAVTLRCDGHPALPIAAGDSFAVPAGVLHALSAPSGDLELLEVTIAPADGGSG
jgi:mannose-6-phosphate isomerase-like protein (cupin superfamily)